MATVYVREFPEELHKKAKIQAVIEGTTLRELIIKATEAYLKKKGR